MRGWSGASSPAAKGRTWGRARTFPLASGPKTSTTLPRGTPPMPSAASSDREPVGMTPCVSRAAMSSLLSPSFMIEPEPCDLTICCSAASRAFSFAVLGGSRPRSSAPGPSSAAFVDENSREEPRAAQEAGAPPVR